MADLFNSTPKKKQLSSRQREILRILDAGGRAVPYKQHDPKRARRYRVEDQNGISIISSLKRMVIDNLFRMDKIHRNDEDGKVWYTKIPTAALSFSTVDGTLTVPKNSWMDDALSASPYNASRITESELNLKYTLQKVRQQLNG